MRPIFQKKTKRRKKGEMSDYEKLHADTLNIWKAAGEIIDYRFEFIQFNLTLSLAAKTTYTPDFFVIYPDHFEVHEVKAGTKEYKKNEHGVKAWTGRWIPFSRGDESITKLKISAAMLPWVKFKLYWYYKNTFGVREIDGR